MAEAVLSSLLQVAFDRLGSLVVEELRLFRGLHKEIENLQIALSTILAVLADAEKQQKDKGVKNWLAMLKYAAYDVDDIWTSAHQKLHEGSWKLKGELQTSYKLLPRFQPISIPPLYFTQVEVA